MNRLILIGNGFDLAHGMQTSYSSFIDSFWKKTVGEINNKNDFSSYENEIIVIPKCDPRIKIQIETFEGLVSMIKANRLSVSYKNKFFVNLSKEKQIKSWVDVEFEYYKALKEALINSKNYNIVQLNEDFEVVKFLLSRYLSGIEQLFNEKPISEYEKIHKKIGRQFYSPFALKDFCESSVNSKIENEFNELSTDLKALQNNTIEFNELSSKSKKLIDGTKSDKELKEKIRKYLFQEGSYELFNLMPSKTLILNFNYTSIEAVYTNPKNFDYWLVDNNTSVSVIHIHGKLNSLPDESIIFGYGDELDEEYKNIEKCNDNNFLENIKSINYLQNSNYKNLLQFINEGYFQVLTFGLSCGNSDRTLLNTIFEHKNCGSIKPFYRIREDGKDNFKDIVANISRNFNENSLMRDLVVNKDFCESI